MLFTTTVVLPLESLSRELSGYFDYRTKPFAPIYAYAEVENEQEACFSVDLWKGPYSKPDSSTLLLDRKKPGSFLFLRWRPDYGRPTFLHHNLGGDVKFGLMKCKAIFWIETSDDPARVHFHQDGLFYDPVQIDGPRGLQGVVIWPGLSSDLWGTRLVEDQAYEAAVRWAQERVVATADCLCKNLGQVLERIDSSNLLKKSYRQETLERLRQRWGSNRNSGASR